MKSSPKVSIVTVVYNDVRHIENTILSVLNQTYKFIEYIIIDGGSTDGTVEIIKRYKAELAYWISEPDNGLYDAMNKGTRVATGEWILFRNSGDYFSSRTDVAKVFNGHSYEGVDILCGKNIRWNKYGYYISTPIIKNHSSKGYRMPVCHPATFVRVKLQKEFLFDTRYKLAADHNFFYQCTKNGKKYQYIPLILSIFDASEGLSSRNAIFSAKEHYYIHRGDKKNDCMGRIKLQGTILLIKVKEWLKKIFPVTAMKILYKDKGVTFWTKDFGIENMIYDAIHNEDNSY